MLMEDVKVTVNVGNTSSDTFNNNMGAPQGDCFSPTIFIWYVTRTLNPQPRPQETNHVYSNVSASQEELPPQSHHIQDHIYQSHQDEESSSPEERAITPRYADNISWLIIGSEELVNYYKETIPPKLTQWNLKCNHETDEEYHITHVAMKAGRNTSILDQNSEQKISSTGCRKPL